MKVSASYGTRTISYAVADSPIGSVLVGEAGNGVCAVLLGDDDESLLRELRERFPGTPVREAADAASSAKKVIAAIGSPSQDSEVPVDLAGTAFQQRVWRALREIPVGETASYTQIAMQIGQPTAARAVARACGANRLAILVPCHRVVRGDGSLAGYRWGVGRKRKLLMMETAAAP